MSALLVAGSPSERSRSAALLDAVRLRLQTRGAHVDQILIRDLSAQALVLANVAHHSLSHAIDLVQEAQVLVVSTPVYKAAYSGVLKLFLDILPQNALKGKTVLPLATGGSPHHMLALDYALRPVLQSLGPRAILPGIYATDAQVALLPEGAYTLDDAIAKRIDEAVTTLVDSALTPRHPVVNGGFAPIPFSQVRCSV